MASGGNSAALTALCATIVPGEITPVSGLRSDSRTSGGPWRCNTASSAGCAASNVSAAGRKVTGFFYKPGGGGMLGYAARRLTSVDQSSELDTRRRWEESEEWGWAQHRF